MTILLEVKEILSTVPDSVPPLKNLETFSNLFVYQMGLNDEKSWSPKIL